MQQLNNTFTVIHKLRTFLAALSYSTEQSPSSEANSFSASQDKWVPVTK